MNWNKEIEKTMNHTYLVLTKNVYFEDDDEDYRLQMLMQNNISGLLPVSRQAINGDNKLYYEISSLMSLEEAFEKKEMDYQSVRELFAGCVNIYTNIEEYMLDGQQIILSPEYIYINPETKIPQFVFYPDYGKEPREAFVELIDYVLEKLDHTDERTVMLGYSIYRITRNKNFTMQEIENVLVEKQESVNSEEDYACEEYVEETRTLTPELRDSISETNGWKDKIKTKKLSHKVNFEINQPPEIIGMIASGIVMSILCGFLLYSVNTGLFLLTDQIVLYMIGAIAMCFMTILMLAYTYMKKRKQVIS